MQNKSIFKSSALKNYFIPTVTELQLVKSILPLDHVDKMHS